MEHTAQSSPDNQRYNDEVVLLDGIYEFHPDLFRGLNEKELHILQRYYLTGQDIPENVFVHRAELAKNNPAVEHEAHAVFEKICKLAGIKQ